MFRHEGCRRGPLYSMPVVAQGSSGDVGIQTRAGIDGRIIKGPFGGCHPRLTATLQMIGNLWLVNAGRKS